MEAFKTKVFSRKFLLAVAAFATFLATGNVHAAQLVVLTYLGSQGITDAAGAFKK